MPHRHAQSNKSYPSVKCPSSHLTLVCIQLTKTSTHTMKKDQQELKPQCFLKFRGRNHKVTRKATGNQQQHTESLSCDTDTMGSHITWLSWWIPWQGTCSLPCSYLRLVDLTHLWSLFKVQIKGEEDLFWTILSPDCTLWKPCTYIIPLLFSFHCLLSFSNPRSLIP